MSAPLVPSPLDYIGRKPFAFDPAIRLVEPNRWLLGARSWSEVQVINATSGCELWIPRKYIGAVSGNDDSLIVALTQTVELRHGDVVPGTVCRILQMPAPPEASTPPRLAVHSPCGPAQIVAIRLERQAPRTIHKAPFRVGIAFLFVAGLLALVESVSR